MTPYFNDCDITVTNSNHKIFSIVFLTCTCEPRYETGSATHACSANWYEWHQSSQTFQKGPQFKIAKGSESKNSPLLCSWGREQCNWIRNISFHWHLQQQNKQAISKGRKQCLKCLLPY